MIRFVSLRTGRLVVTRAEYCGNSIAAFWIFNTDVAYGLSSVEAAERLKKFGPNELVEKEDNKW